MSSVSRKRPRPEGNSLSIGSESPPEPARRVKEKKTFSPRMDKYENVDSGTVTAKVELPGLKREDVTISFLHDKVTISGEVVDEKPKEGSRTYTCRELSCGKFSRCLTVPLGFRPEHFKARMENGLLTVTYPKDPPHQNPYHISIE